MEEAKLNKTCSGKETPLFDPSALHQQCQEQLLRLNQQLSHHISCERNAKLNRIIPSISSLSQQIQDIENNIGREVTLEESTSQKHLLLQQKEALISNIQAHSRKIERFKRQTVTLNINHEELLREFEENRKIIEDKEAVFSSLPAGMKNESRVAGKESRVAVNKKGSMPSQFSNNLSRLQTNRSSMETDEGESKWSRIDRQFDRLSGLQFTGLARALVGLAKRENGNIKSVFRNYKADDKMGEFSKSQAVRQELLLLKTKKK
jgi:hypothetical protein